MNKPKAGDPRQPGERWCDHCTDWRGIITTGAELDQCPTCREWRGRATDTATVITFDRADNRGDIFPAGCVKTTSGIPVTVAFDPGNVLGTATIREDGTAEITFGPRVPECFQLAVPVSLGFRVIREHTEGGVRVFDEIEPISLGIERQR